MDKILKNRFIRILSCMENELCRNYITDSFYSKADN